MVGEKLYTVAGEILAVLDWRDWTLATMVQLPSTAVGQVLKNEVLTVTL